MTPILQDFITYAKVHYNNESAMTACIYDCTSVLPNSPNVDTNEFTFVGIFKLQNSDIPSKDQQKLSFVFTLPSDHTSSLRMHSKKGNPPTLINVL